MKQLIILFLFITVTIFSQVIYDGGNSTTTNLGSGKTFTGVAKDCQDYTTITVMVYANKASATNGLKVQFSPDGTSTWKTKSYWTYAINDSLRTFNTDVQGHYYRIVYTNTADSQTSFYLKSYLSNRPANNYDESGSLKVNAAVTITGGSTATEQLAQGLTFDSTKNVLIQSRDSLAILNNNIRILKGYLDGVDSLRKPVYLSITDTLAQADTISQYAFDHQYTDIKITVKDTTGGSALKDTLVVEKYILGVWIRVALKDTEQDTTITGNETVVPGNGATRTYQIINEKYLGTIRARRTNVAVLSRKTPIRFEAVRW